MIKKFTINRKKWLRGEKESCLLKRDGRMCCLGFYALARGLKQTAILGKPAPNSLFSYKKGERVFSLPELIKNGSYKNNMTCQSLMTANDNRRTDDTHKEKVIKNNFAKLGVEVKFVG